MFGSHSPPRTTGWTVSAQGVHRYTNRFERDEMGSEWGVYNPLLCEELNDHVKLPNKGPLSVVRCFRQLPVYIGSAC
jgi:hypothetical protein